MRQLKAFRQGFTTAILNPKLLCSSLVLPQFIVSNQNHFFQFLFIRSHIYDFDRNMVFALYLANTSIKNFLRKERVNRIMEGITGAVLLVFGVRLFSKNKYVYEKK